MLMVDARSHSIDILPDSTFESPDTGVPPCAKDPTSTFTISAAQKSLIASSRFHRLGINL